MPSTITKLTFLSLLSSALAHPRAFGAHHHRHVHPSGTGAPYAMGNGSHPHPHGSGTGTGIPSSTDLPAESTTTIDTTIMSTVVQTVVLTAIPVPQSSAAAQSVGVAAVSGGVSGGEGAGASGAASGGVCSVRPTSTVTVTDRITVTVQPSAAAVVSSSKSKACSKKTKLSSASLAPVETLTPVASSASSSDVLPLSSFSLFSSVVAAVSTPVASPSSSSTPVAVSSVTPSSPPVPSSTPVASSTPVSSSAPAATSSTASYGTGKRGLAYNDASLTDCFVGNSEVSWAYNWGETTSGLSSSFEYTPMLWGLDSTWTTSWKENAQAAIDGGSTHLLCFNEPDLSTQANLSPDVAATGYKTYMEPLKASNPSVKLGAPAVTNGGGSMGLSWLASFMENCSGCDIDFVPIHWYDSASNIDYFKSHVQDAYDQTGKPIWVTEFGASGDAASISTFLQEAMAWMDSQDFVERYAYFMVADGNLVTGTSLSSLGSVYAAA